MTTFRAKHRAESRTSGFGIGALATILALGLSLWFGVGLASAQDEPAPSYSVSESTDLLDGQSITISGESFDPFARLFFHQCSVVDEFACSGLGFGTVSSDGTFEETVTVGRVVIGSTTRSARTYDCALSGCVITMGAEGLRPDPLAISFDASVAPPAPPARIVASLAEPLVDGQLVAVTIEDQAKNVRGELVQCRLDSNGDFPTDCINVSPRFVENSSTSEATIRVRRVLHDVFDNNNPDANRFEPVDCASGQNKCVLGFRRTQNREIVSTEVLTFDQTAPLLKPTVTSTKRKGLPQGDSVSITISNSLDESVFVYQCPRTAETHTDPSCRLLDTQRRTPSNRSVPTLEAFTLTVDPARLLGSRGEGRVDCTVRRSCNVHVVSNRVPMKRLALRIAGPERSDELSVRVRPRKNLADSAEVSVQVRNASPKQVENLTVYQCAIGSEDLSTCLPRSAAELKTNKRISIHLTSVNRMIEGFDCAAEVARCELRVHGADELLGSVPLQFSERSPAPTPTAQATVISALAGVQRGQDLIGYITGGFQNQVEIWQCVADSADTAPAGCVALDAKTRSVVSPNDTSLIWEFGVVGTVDGVDCVADASVCALRFEVDDVLLDEVFELQMDPGEAPKSQSSVTPTTGLRDGDTVEITVAVEDQVSPSTFIALCGFSKNHIVPSTCTDGLAVPEPGTYSMQVQRFMAVEGVDETWDCASASRACRVLLLDGRITRFGLTFAATE